MIIRNQPTGFYCRFDAQTPTKITGTDVPMIFYTWIR